VRHCRIRLIVFDLEGTLVDSSRDLATAINATLGRIAPHAPPLAVEEVRTFIGNGARNLLTRSLERAGIARVPDEAFPIFLAAYRNVLLETTSLYPGVRESLDQLSDRRLAVLTNKPGDMTRTILEGLGVASQFDRICGGDDLSATKPDPAGLTQLVQEAKAIPEETLMVGDTAIDVRTGRAAGARTAGVTYGFDSLGVRRESPDMLADTFPGLLVGIQKWESAL
jgi:phosphoglycolate phosphatase